MLGHDQLPHALGISCAGDAKGVLARVPEGITETQTVAEPKAITLTQEHKAILAAERARISRSGGQVVNGRLEGLNNER